MPLEGVRASDEWNNDGHWSALWGKWFCFHDLSCTHTHTHTSPRTRTRWAELHFWISWNYVNDKVSWNTAPWWIVKWNKEKFERETGRRRREAEKSPEVSCHSIKRFHALGSRAREKNKRSVVKSKQKYWTVVDRFKRSSAEWSGQKGMNRHAKWRWSNLAQ